MTGTPRASVAPPHQSPAQWALLVVGLLATVAVTIYVTRLARKAIKEHTVMSEDTSSSPGSNGPGLPASHSGRFGTIVTVAVAVVLAVGTAYAYANRSLISGLFGPPVVALAETYPEKPDGPAFDHSAFDALLKKHVDDAGFVDYKGLAGDAAQLDGYIASLVKAPIERMGRSQRLALLIDAYNAFTVRLILDHYPVKSIKAIPADKRWDARRWNIGGQILRLNQIEHQEIRPHFKEPRIHFALVCAAVGCPPLRNEAYTAGKLEEQLASQSEYVHTHDRWFQFDPNANVLRLTSLYNWYGSDFEQAAGSVAQFASRYFPALKQAMNAGRKPKVQFLDYDWSLNGKENKR